MELQIKEGSYYRRRDGQVCKAEKSFSENVDLSRFPWILDDICYPSNGNYYYSLDNDFPERDSSYQIIEEVDVNCHAILTQTDMPNTLWTVSECKQAYESLNKFANENEQLKKELEEESRQRRYLDGVVIELENQIAELTKPVLIKQTWQQIADAPPALAEPLLPEKPNWVSGWAIGLLRRDTYKRHDGTEYTTVVLEDIGGNT